MITMKKKALVAMAMAAAMVAMPVVAGAVTSPGSQSDGTIGQDSSSQSQNNTNTGSQQGEQNSDTNAGSNAGSGVNKVAEATVVQGRDNERQEVTNVTKDGSEVTMGLIEDASNSDVDQSIATVEDESAGLGDESVIQINGLIN